jgi:hypothetical protein
MRGRQMTKLDNANLLIESVRSRLGADDDPEFWAVALKVLADEFLRRYDGEAKNRKWILVVGACSRWVRPHNSSWNAAGGFVYPQGYLNSLPEMDWSIVFSYQDQLWSPIKKLPGKKQMVFRVSAPARSLRHKQAVVHTQWSASQDPVFYGFRKLDGTWKCVAASDERLEGSIKAYEDMTHP